MIDFGVVVVRAAGQHNAARAGFLHPRRVSAPFSRMSRLKASSSAHAASTAASISACVGAATPFAHELRMRLHKLYHQAFLQVVFLVVRQPRIQELHIGSREARRYSGAAPRRSLPRWGN